MTALPRLRPVNPPPPDPVAGYVVVQLGSRPGLTHATLMEREDAETEAAQWHAKYNDRWCRVAKVVLL